MADRRIKVRKSTTPRVDMVMVAEGLGAKVVDLPELSKTEAEQYQQLGSPVMMPEADRLYVYHFGSRMLSAYGRSLDDVIGYRVLDADEEPEFRKQCGNGYATVVQYYGKT